MSNVNNVTLFMLHVLFVVLLEFFNFKEIKL